MMKTFERMLFQSRWLMIIPVIVSIILALLIVVFALKDVVLLISSLVSTLSPTLSETARADIDRGTITKIIEIVDEYLLSAVLVVFAFGLYELFIGKIDIIEHSEVASRLLLIHSIDDLKSRLANVVILILIVKFFQIAVNLKYSTPADLLLLAVGIALIGGALFLTHQTHSNHDDPLTPDATTH